MFGYNMLGFGASASAGGVSLTSVAKSALYVDGNSEFLVRTLSGAGTSRKTFTLGGWFYKTKVGSGSDCRIFQWDNGTTNTDRGMILIDNTTPDAIKLLIEDASDVATMIWTTTQLIRDQAWYHWCLTVDTVPSTPIFKFFLNNEEITAWTKGTDTIAQDDVFTIVDSGARQAWGSAPEGSGYFDGYQAECFYLDGQVVTDATDFVDVSDDGLYVTPKSNADMQTLTFGINGYYLANLVTGAPQLDFQAGDDNTLALSEWKSLLHFDGSDASTTLTDSASGQGVWTAAGNAQLDTAQKKFGTASLLLDGTGDYISKSGVGKPQAAAFTIDMWVRRNGANTNNGILCFGAWGDASNTLFRLLTGTDNKLIVSTNSAGIIAAGAHSTSLPDGEWVHVALTRSSDTLYLFQAGILLASGSFSYTMSGTDTWNIGQDIGAANNFNGHIDECRIILGTCEYTTNFTPETSAYSNPPTANNFTNTNTVTLSTHTPTNLENRWNPLWSTTGETLSNANKTGQVTNSGNQTITSTLTLPSTGKWYIELDCDTETYAILGLLNANASGGELIFNQGSTARGYYQACELYGYYSHSGLLFTEGTGSGGNSASYGTAYDNSDYIGIAADCDNGNLFFSNSGTWQNSATAGEIAAGTGTNAATTNLDNEYVVALFGAGSTEKFTFVDEADWSGTAPTGFIALTTTNIAAETTRTAADVGEHWNNFLYTGNGTAIGSGGNALTGMGFQPDFLWIKNRDSARSPDVNDVLLTVEDFLYTDSTGALGTSAESLSAFGSDGFTVGSNLGWNESSDKLISWSAKLGGAPTATNSAGAGATPTAGSVKIDDVNLGSALAGSIAATKITANTILGMSATTFTGTGANATVAHGLGVAPSMVIIKGLDTVNHWAVYHKGTGNTTASLLNATNAKQSDDAKWWNNTTPTSTVVTIGTAGDLNASTKLFIMYAFAPSEFTSFGSYEGTGAVATAPYIPTLNSLGVPIQPIYILQKNVDGAFHWQIYDTARTPNNPSNLGLYANSAGAEVAASTDNLTDIVTGGFKPRGTGDPNRTNTSIYMAIGTPIIDVDGRIIAGK